MNNNHGLSSFQFVQGGVQYLKIYKEVWNKKMLRTTSAHAYN